VGDILADIDSVLAAGEPEPAVALCPHCEDEWHGLPITRRMRDMAFYGHVDADYRYADDGSEVLCPGAGVDAVMLRRPAPCDCDLCSGRFEAFMRTVGMQRIALVELDENDPAIVAAMAASQELVARAPGPQFGVGFE